jgi:hypothetical protein
VCERHREQLEGVLVPFKPLGQGIEACSDDVGSTAFGGEEALIRLRSERAVRAPHRGFIGPDLLQQLGVDVGLLSDSVAHRCAPAGGRDFGDVLGNWASKATSFLLTR